MVSWGADPDCAEVVNGVPGISLPGWLWFDGRPAAKSQVGTEQPRCSHGPLFLSVPVDAFSR